VEKKSVTRNSDGIRRTLVTDSDKPEQFGVYTEQVLDEIIDGIARDRDNQKERSVNRLLARIPMLVYERACHEAWGEDDWKKYLNSSEAAPFRIWRGRV
jgi:hypothetical protein